MKQNLSSLINDEVVKIIAIGSEELLKTENIVRIGLTTEIINKINKAIKMHNQDPQLVDYRVQLIRPFSFEVLRDDFGDAETISPDKNIYTYLYEKQQHIGLAEDFESYNFETVEKRNKSYLSVRFYDHDESSAIGCEITVDLSSVFFYIQCDKGYIIETQSLVSLGVDIDLEGS